MTDEELKRLFAVHQAAAPAAPADRRACPDPERLRALAEREGPEAQRLATLDHATICAACRADYDLLAATATLRPRSPIARWPLALAATALLAVSGTLLWSVRSADRERGEPTTIRIHAPSGAVDPTAPVSLVWTPVPDAFSYHLEILGADGAVRFTGVTRDTLLTLPDSVRQEGNGELFWWVRAALPDGGEVHSELTGFRWRR